MQNCQRALEWSITQGSELQCQAVLRERRERERGEPVHIEDPRGWRDRVKEPNLRAILRDPRGASFLVLEGDPLEDFDHVRSIRVRVRQGHVLTLER